MVLLAADDISDNEEVYYRITAIDYTVGVMQCSFGLTSTTLNILVIIGFIKLGLKGKIANILYCALSISDTLTGISSIVYSILILDQSLELLTGDESFFNVFKLKEGFRICIWMGPLFAFSMMMTISLINAITFCRTFAVAVPFYYKLYLKKSAVLLVVFMLAAHALVIGIIPLTNDIHVYFLDAHSGICAIIPLPGLDQLLRVLQLSLVTIPITIHCAMVVLGTLALIYLLKQRRKKMCVNEHIGLLSRCYKSVTSLARRDSITEAKKEALNKQNSGQAGNSNAAIVDKATQRAERTVLGLLCSFTVTYSFWLVGFYMQVHATNKVELPAAWFGITPHVSYYMFRSEEQKRRPERYFLFTAYGPLFLVILVLLNSAVNPIIHLVFNKDLRDAVFFWTKKKRSTPSNSNGSNPDKKVLRRISVGLGKPFSNNTVLPDCLASPTICVEMKEMNCQTEYENFYSDDHEVPVSDILECTNKEFNFLADEMEGFAECGSGSHTEDSESGSEGGFDESSSLENVVFENPVAMELGAGEAESIA